MFFPPEQDAFGYDWGLYVALFFKDRLYKTKKAIELAPEANGHGFQVVIFGHDSLPDPVNNGFSASPGSSYQIRITLLHFERLGPPYSKCA